MTSVCLCFALGQKPQCPTLPASQGHITAPEPRFKCPRCGHRRLLHPAEIGFFPAAPDGYCALYSNELLRFTSAYMGAGKRTAKTLGKALASFHAANGCARGDADAIWRNLGPAAQQWQLVDTAARAKRRWAHCALSTLWCLSQQGPDDLCVFFAQQLILVELQTLQVVYLP